MENITAKQIGNNLIIVIDGKQYTKVEKDKEKREKIKNKILLYNKKPSKERKEELIKLFDKKEVKREELKAKAKGAKKIVKKEGAKSQEKKDFFSTIEKRVRAKDLTKDETQKAIGLLSKLIEKNKKIVKEEPKPIATQSPRRGEH